jgi:hypothetical protein
MNLREQVLVSGEELRDLKGGIFKDWGNCKQTKTFIKKNVTKIGTTNYDLKIPLIPSHIFTCKGIPFGPLLYRLYTTRIYLWSPLV